MAEHKRFEAALDILEGHLNDTSAWGLPNDAEDDGWEHDDYADNLEDAIAFLEAHQGDARWLTAGT